MDQILIKYKIMEKIHLRTNINFLIALIFDPEAFIEYSNDMQDV